MYIIFTVIEKTDTRRHMLECEQRVIDGLVNTDELVSWNAPKQLSFSSDKDDISAVKKLSIAK